ncbi:hypothetical protein ACUOFC_32085, partial [Escherichia sp. TWPC-MK]
MLVVTGCCVPFLQNKITETIPNSYIESMMRQPHIYQNWCTSNTGGWRPVLGAIAAFGAFGFLGLLFGMKDPVRSVPGEHSDSAMQNIGMLFNRKLLAGALVT